MVNTTEFIIGLMKENTNELGFIPSSAIEHRFVKQGDYIIQYDLKGKKVGYLIHGPLHFGKPLHIYQYCIEYDMRRVGFGFTLFNELLKRAEANCSSSIHLRCGEDLDAIEFWHKLGFRTLLIVRGGKARNRLIAEMRYPCSLMIFDGHKSDADYKKEGV